MDLYLGTYTMPILFGTGEILQGKGEGIYRLRLEEGVRPCPELVARTENPSYLALGLSGTRLYAVNELKEYEGKKQGAVSAFMVGTDGGLTLLNTKPTGGQDPCHLLVTRDDRFLLAANFMTGSVCVYTLEPDGSLGRRTAFVRHEGRGADPKRQAGPHAHSVIETPDGRHYLVPDLGLDKVMVYRLEQDGGLVLEGAIDCQPGSGPRFGEFHPNGRWFYLIGELASSVTVFRYDGAAGFVPVQTVPTIPHGEAANICADLHITPDGRYLYASNRGHDSLTVFAIQGDGLLAEVQNLPCEGRTPRQFALLANGTRLCVGKQDSDNISIFMIQEDGRLVLESTFDVPTPVCILSTE